MTYVIFACVHSAGRSQMAAAFWNAMVTDGRRAMAAGTAPSDRVHPVVVEAMKDVNIDLSEARPELLTPELLSQARVFVTMGCEESCPSAPPGLLRYAWTFEDPKGRSIDEVRAIRDSIREHVQQLASSSI